MNLTPILAVLTLASSVAIIALILLGLRKALVTPPWTARDRDRLVKAFAIALIGWFMAATVSAWLGAYQATPDRMPTIQYALLAPIIIGAWLIWRSPTVALVIDAIPQHWLVGVQIFRILGGIFLVLYAMGKMPGVFAWPAGVGDLLVGALSPVIAIAYARAPRMNADLVLWWNILGLTDLIVAVATGVSSSPSAIQITAFDHPNELISMFPLVLVPAFLVPLWILLHIASLAKLRRGVSIDEKPHGVAISHM
jgi:hypothetical protein